MNAASEFLLESLHFRGALKRLLERARACASGSGSALAAASMTLGDVALRCAQCDELALTRSTVDDQRCVLGEGVVPAVRQDWPDDELGDPALVHRTGLVRAIDYSNRLYRKAALISTGEGSAAFVAIAQLNPPAIPGERVQNGHRARSF